MKNKYCVLILSCDKYADLWKPFFELFWDNWPDCPYRVYLGSNTIEYKKDKRIKTILSGEDTDWSTSYKAILKKIPEKYLFVWVEDGFITSKVDTARIKRIFKFMLKAQGKHIHIRPVPKPDTLQDNDYGIYDKGAPYRVNLVGFWDKNYLQQLLIDGETTWNFEIMGSYRTSYTEGFFCLRKPLFNYIHVVEKGRWFTNAIDYCKQNKVPINIPARLIIAEEKRILSILQAVYFNYILSIRWKYRVKIMNILRKLLISY